MVDYRINLAKSVTSTPEQRRKFYNGMILYLSVCAAGLVYVAYTASFNIKEGYRANRQRKQMVDTVGSVLKPNVGKFAAATCTAIMKPDLNSPLDGLLARSGRDITHSLLNSRKLLRSILIRGKDPYSWRGKTYYDR